MIRIVVASLLSIVPALAYAGTTKVETSKLPAKEVYGVAELTPLALSEAGTPSVVLLDLEAGDVVPPHATKKGLRLLTVLKGEMSWGDGNEIDENKENIYPAGTILVVPATVDHWLAARSGDVQIQLVVLEGENPVPGILEQMR